MRKIVVSEFVSLDGVFEDPGGSEHTHYGGWNLPFMQEEEGKYKYNELFSSDALLLGRKTYGGFAKAWPKMEGTGDFGERMNSIPKYVVSHSLKKAPWKNSTIISNNVASEIARLKEQEGQNILVAGSGMLVQFLLEAGLVDEIRLMVHPLILGKGRHLFEGTHTKLHLFETQEFANGVIALHYEPETALV